jgi:hypothetical protein
VNLTFNDAIDANDILGGDSVPFVTLVSPHDGATGVRPDVPIILELSDGLRAAPLWSSIQIVIEGTTVWSQGAVQNGWSADLETPPGVLRWVLWPPEDFTYRETVNVQTSFDYGAARAFADALTTSDVVALG